MSDDDASPTAKKTEKLDELKKLVEALTALVSSGEPEPADEAAKTKSDEAQDGAAYARKKYDFIVKWMLGFFGLVAVFIFGSVPFVGISEISGLALPGLILAVVGFAAVVHGTTSAYEPQDASLGELANTLKAAEKRRRWRWAWRFLNPVWVADDDLAKVLNPDNIGSRREPDHSGKTSGRIPGDETGDTDPGPDERQAHLGPYMHDVPTLIKTIGALEKSLLHAKIGTLAVSGRDFSLVKKMLGVEDLSQADGSTSQSELVKFNDLIRGGSIVAEAMMSKKASDSIVPSQAAEKAVERAEVIGHVREMYLGHRTLLLQESAVAQLRGRFRKARRYMILGAILMGVGGVIYAASAGQGSAGEADPSKGAYVSVRIPAALVNDIDDDDCVTEIEETTPIQGITPDALEYVVQARLLKANEFELYDGECVGTIISFEPGEVSWIRAG